MSNSTPITARLLLLATFWLCANAVRAQAPAWQWGLQTTNPTPTDNTSARGLAVATDAAGRAYVGGVQEPAITGNPLPVRSFGSAGSTVAGRTGFVAQATPAGQWAWMMPVVATGANTSNGYYTQVTGIAATAAGDVYATGTVMGTSILIGGQTQAVSSTSIPASGIFVARFNSAGTCQWVRAVAGNSGSLNAPTLALDPSTGGVVVAGTYTGTPAFGATTLPSTLGSANGAIFVARLSASGQWLGAAASGGTTGAMTEVTIAVGAAGQVGLVTSQHAGTLTFGTTTLTVPTGIDQSYVVAQLSPGNQWAWAVGGGASSNSSWTIGAAYTPTGALWVSGRGNNGTTLGTTTLLAPLGGGADSFAGFLGQLSATGQWNLVRQFAPSGTGLGVVGPLTVDGAGNALALGGLAGFTGPVQTTLGGQQLATTGSEVLLFVAALNNAGQWRYVTAVPQPALNNGLSPTGIALDATGSLFMTGAFRGSLTLGPSMLTGSYSPTATYPNYGDVVLGKLTNATVLAARPATASPTLACFPNPAHAEATLAGARPGSQVTVFDALGRRATAALADVAGKAVLVLPAGTPAGVYVVRAGSQALRLVVE